MKRKRAFAIKAINELSSDETLKAEFIARVEKAETYSEITSILTTFRKKVFGD